MKKNPNQDELLKQTIQPAKWVHENVASYATDLYAIYIKKHRKLISEKKTPLPGTVPYSIRMRGIEKLVTDPMFEKFWRDVGEYEGLLVAIHSSYVKYSISPTGGYRSITPQISRPERDRRLTHASKILKKFIDEINSDISVKNCFRFAVIEALNEVKIIAPKQEIIDTVLNKLHGSLIAPKGVRTRVNTHRNLPRSLNQGKKADRALVIYSVSKYIKVVYERYNHALTARILNAACPHLGPFSADAVRGLMKRHP